MFVTLSTVKSCDYTLKHKNTYKPRTRGIWVYPTLPTTSHKVQPRSRKGFFQRRNFSEKEWLSGQSTGSTFYPTVQKKLRHYHRGLCILWPPYSTALFWTCKNCTKTSKSYVAFHIYPFWSPRCIQQDLLTFIFTSTYIDLPLAHQRDSLQNESSALGWA